MKGWSLVAMKVVGLVLLVSLTDGHSFTSYANLLKLYYMEEEALSNADVLLREEFFHHGNVAATDGAHNLTALRQLVNETKQIHAAVGTNIEKYLSHPVNVFGLTKRLLQRWRLAIKTIRKSKPCREWHIPHILARLANIEDNLPTEEDFESVAYSLLLIQHTQGLRTADLLAGRIGGHLAADRISLQDQFQVAKMAVDRDDYYYAAQWLKNMETSGRLAQLRKDEHGFNATNVLGMLASAYFRINMVPEALRATDELLKSDPDNVVGRSNKKNRNTCRLVRSEGVLWYHKVEILRKKPPILVFHDVFSSQLMREFVVMAKEEYERLSLDTEFKTPEFTLALSRLATTQQRLQLGKVRSTLVKLPFTVTYPFKAGESEVGFSGGWLAGELGG
ncbi:hypothetical protein C0Q70_01697 [Pomacea canaliculata]|uniref:Uncharacterized protein n=1 Tax=Pomacea canaliculata TaxID=400727 RepID=A0A2T7Q073_POMCA|nr:hypothetical protein C0Q70_01697 [Pomacea canaliculata]